MPSTAIVEWLGLPDRRNHAPTHPTTTTNMSMLRDMPC